MFAQLAMDMAKQKSYKDKAELNKENTEMIQQLKSMANDQVEDPFRLVLDDLDKTKEFAINNILRT